MSRLHPEMAAILAEQRAAGLPAPETLPLAAARAGFLRANAAWNAPLPPMQAEDATLGGVACRVLRPDGAGAGSTLFVHGGGWTFGAPASHERFARLLAQFASCAVVVPDYRLAPEHPAPAGIEDVLSVAAEWEAPGPLVLCGDSAGANIALAAALSGLARPASMLSLLYGCFAPDFGTPSHAANGGGDYGLTTARMRWYWQNWLGAATDPRAAPLRADLASLARLPPCHLLAAALDPLCDDSIALAGRLAAAGVPARLDVVPGVVHGFLQMTSRLAPAMAAARLVAATIATALNDKNDPEGNAPWMPQAAPP